MSRVMFALGLGALLVLPASSADWLHFRGTATNAVANAPLPLAWDDAKQENVAWKADLPGRGVSSPIVVGGQVVITASSGYRQDRLHVLSFDAKSGKPLWHRQFWATGRTLCHPTSANAAPSPTSDGQLIYAFYSSNDLVCLDLEGNLRWFRGLTHDYPRAANDVGMAASPVVAGDAVVVQVECKGESFAAGIDKQTGETRWKLPRAQDMNWASPSLLKTESGELVLLQSPDRLSAHDPQTGQEIWSHAATCDAIPSTVADGKRIFVPTNNGMAALKVPSAGETPEELWLEKKLGPGSGSPLVHSGRLYSVSRANVLTCAEPETGKMLWQLRLKGPFWASALAAGEHLYCVNQDGVAQVVKLADDKGEVVSEIPFGEAVLGSPAAVDGALYVRSDGHLWKIASGS